MHLNQLMTVTPIKCLLLNAANSHKIQKLSPDIYYIVAQKSLINLKFSHKKCRKNIANYSSTVVLNISELKFSCIKYLSAENNLNVCQKQ